MTQDIHELYEQAAVLHGHKCPGLAMGVRAAAEARRILAVEDIQDKELCCVAESAACYLDGIQVVMGCTVGKGNLILRPTGKSAFSFYRGAESVRILMNAPHFDGDKSAKIEHILTAPADEVMQISAPRAPLPVKAPRCESVRCSKCGEPTRRDALTERDGLLLCADCV